MRFSWITAAVLLLAVLIRSGVLLSTPAALRTDPDGYRRLAENLVAHQTFGVAREPTAYRPPLYPLMLAGCIYADGGGRIAIGLLHVFLGVATVFLTIVLGRQWGLGKYASAAAALLVACDPILLAQSGQVMTETPAALLVVAGLVMLTWTSRVPTAGRAFWTGGVLAAGALCRPVLLPADILAGAALVWLAYRRALPPDVIQTACGGLDRRRPRGAAVRAGHVLLAFALGATVVLGPWAVRNRIQFGRTIVTTTHGGYTLYLANNPDFYHWLRTGAWGSVWWSSEFDAAWNRSRPRDELQADRLAYEKAVRTIRHDPRTFAEACLVRLGRFWAPLPHQITPQETPLCRAARYGVAVWYAAEFLLVIVGIAIGATAAFDRQNIRAADRSPTWLWGLLFVADLTAAHTVYWTDMRMRAPVMPIVALAAVASASLLLPRRKDMADAISQRSPEVHHADLPAAQPSIDP